MTITPPTIVGTRSTQGLGPSAVPGNLSWNDDGQAAFFTSRSIVILTPHILSSLPPPPSYIDPEPTLEHPSAKVAKFRKKQAGGEDDPMEGDGDEDDGVAGPSRGGGKKMRIPKNGEVGWYVNGVDVREVDRTEIYEWTDVGDEFSAILAADDLSAQAIAWSPSGLSDLGSCLLAVMTTQGQVSIYTPSGDPYTKPWVEIADMTVLTRSSLKKQDAHPVSVPGMLQMRATCIQWSPAPPLKSYFGIDLSLLAIANRGGRVVLWWYGPKRKFEKALGAEVTTGWVISMSWSAWQQVDENTCIAKLALACSDGSVAVLHVRQTASIDQNGEVSCKVAVVKDEKVPDKDARAISGLTWVNDILVICRAGSITLWSAAPSRDIQWTGCKRIVLSQVGNWAGANPLTSCVGIHSLSPDSLLIVLAGHTHHIIANISTSPTLADPSSQLNLSVAARQVFLDHIQGDMFEDRQTAKQDAYLRSLTAWTTGWSGLGEAGVTSWAGEGVNFHNMESNPEGQRKTTFVLADMGGLVPGRRPIMDCLEDILEDPPSVILSSPVRILMPHLVRIISAPDQASISAELVDLLSSESANESDLDRSKDGDRSLVLRSSLWAHSVLDGLRVRYALARWCLSSFPAQAQLLSGLVTEVQGAIDRMITDSILTWAATSCQSNLARDYTKDIPFLRLLLNSAPSQTAESETLNAVLAKSGSAENIDSCPACGESVSVGDANGISRCNKGHEWSRCSVTRLLITHPKYRVCSVCPAISLLPPSIISLPIAVDESGKDTDYTRFEKKMTGKGRGGKTEAGIGLAEELLEVAIVCLRCGGRWVRVF